MYRWTEIFQIIAPLIIFLTGVMEIAVAVMESKKEKGEKVNMVAEKEYSE